MRVVKVDLPSDMKQAEIHVGADWHLGDPYCREDIVRARIEAVRNKDNAYLIMNGDVLNNATKFSVSDIYAEKESPMQQIHHAIDLLSPIKDKVIAVTSGNHCNRTYRNDGIDLMEIVCRELGISDKYSQTSCMVFVRLGKDTTGGKNSKSEHRKHCYTIYALHGSGGGRKEGAKAIRLADMASIIDASVYIHSHTHLPMIMKQSFFQTIQTSSSVKKVDRLFVNTGATLEYGGYACAQEFKPATCNATPVIYLSGEKYNATASL